MKWIFSSILMIMVIDRGITAESVHLSQQKGSFDSALCGTEKQPCATFSYALLKVSLYGGELIIDGGIQGAKYQPYHIMNPYFSVHKKLTIKKREYANQKSVSPTLLHMKGGLFYGNLTIISIKMMSTKKKFPFISFIVLGKHLRIINCTFHYITATHTTKEANVFISNSNISVYNQFNSRSALWIGRTEVATLQMKVSENITSISNSMLMKGQITNVISKLYITNSSFKDVNIFMNSAAEMTLFNSNFSGTNSYKIIVTYLHPPVTIVRCQFDGISLMILSASHTIIKNTTFKNIHKSSHYSALYIRSTYSLTMHGCEFKNNSAVFGVPSSIDIYSAQLSTLSVVGVYFHGHRDDKILMKVDVENRETNKIKMFMENVNMVCGIGQYHNITILEPISKANYFCMTSCRNCPIGSYNLLKRPFGITTKKQPTVRCLTCPFGGLCSDGKLKSKGGYWGYIIEKYTGDSEVKFITCPKYGCCPTPEKCLTYNTCAPNRIGRLCSQCRQGYSCSVTGNQRCVRNETCINKHVNILVYFTTVAFYLLVILYLREIILTLKRIFKREQMKNVSTDNLEQLKERLIPEYFKNGEDGYSTILLHGNVPSEEYKTTSVMSGSLKVFFFFYQAAAIIRVDTSEKLKIFFPIFLDTISSFFNIRPDISYSSFSVCFMENMQNIHVDILRGSLIVVMIFCVLLLVLFLKVRSTLLYVLKKRRLSIGDNVENYNIHQIGKNIPSYNKLPFHVRLKCAYLQLLLIGFTGISLFAFQLIHCVKINEELYLFMQASIKCYQPWQITLCIFIGVWVLPFPITLYFSSNDLYRCNVTPTQFLTGITFPPFYLVIIIIRRFIPTTTSMTVKDAMLAKHLLIVLSEPFCEMEDGGRICWEAILMMRRIILVIIHTFMAYSIQRMFLSVIVIIASIAHHNFVKPYKDEIVNTIENTSLFALVSLCFVNMFWAFTSEYNLMTSEAYRIFASFLLYFELALLLFPLVILVFGAIMYVLKMLYKRFSSKQD